MATNPPSGDGHRNGAVKSRSQTQTPSGHWVKRDVETGQFMDVKTTGGKFKGETVCLAATFKDHGCENIRQNAF